jgi:hypothetical protein
MLGVGLHSYGFMDRAFGTLMGLTEGLIVSTIERNFMSPENSGTPRLRLFSRASIEISDRGRIPSVPLMG